MAEKKGRIDDLVGSMMSLMKRKTKTPPVGIDKQIEYLDAGSNFIANFKMKPAELAAFLKRHVVKQDEAIDVLSAKICGHFNAIRMRLKNGEQPMDDQNRIKSNILLIGPTGVGKTLLCQMISKKIGVPFIKEDITKNSEAGYVGEDVEDIIRKLIYKTKDILGDPDVSLAQYGIVFIDEIDKIATGDGYGHDVSRKGVQQALLSLVEDTDIPVLPKSARNNPVDPVMVRRGLSRGVETINTKNILFIFAGAFPGLQETIRKRLGGGKTVGFISDTSVQDHSADILSQVETGDLEKFGMITELLGRMPVRVALENLDEADLFEILRRENSPIVRQFKDEMASYGIEVEIEEEVLRHIAKKAVIQKTGARGLKAAFDKAMSIYEKELPAFNIPFMRFSLPLVDGSVDQRAFLDALKKKFSEMGLVEVPASEVVDVTDEPEGVEIETQGWLGDKDFDPATGYKK